VTKEPAGDEVQLLAELLSVPLNGRYPTLDLTPQRKKERTFEALLRQLAGLTRRQPVLMIFEDLHWADPSSRELLDLTVEQIERLPVLLMATFRPEFQSAWTGQPHVTTLSLRRLGREESSALIHALIGDAAALSAEVVDEIVERTDGVPLFAEELTKAVLETAIAGAGISAVPATTLAVPATLHASLMARLDRLGPTAKEVAQIAAAIGREFSYELLVGAAQHTEAEVEDGLGGLVNAGLVFQRGAIPDAAFSFKHALVRDAAHSTLLRGPRQQLHARIAEALEAISPELMDTQPEVFAQHCAEAGLIEKSMTYWGRAGKRSVARSALAEAAVHFHKALDQLANLPSTPERQRQALELWGDLGSVLLAVKGHAAPETGQANAKAHELWEQLGSPLEYLRVPFGQSIYRQARGDMDSALSLAADLLRLSSRRNNTAGLVLGHYCSGRNMMLAGRFTSSRSHLEEAVALYNPISHHSLVSQTGIHPQALSQAYLGSVLFCLGYLEQAWAHTNRAIAEARGLKHPPSIAGSLATAARLLSLVADNKVLGECIDELNVTTAEQGFPHWGAEGAVYEGWVTVRNGDVRKGISLLGSGLKAYRTNGGAAGMPHFIALLARAYEIAGELKQAMAQLNAGLHFIESTGTRWLEAELNRHKAELLLRQGHSAAAEELYRQALGIAVKQEARLWELRAAVSLGRLWRDQGRRCGAARDGSLLAAKTATVQSGGSPTAGGDECVYSSGNPTRRRPTIAVFSRRAQYGGLECQGKTARNCASD
jgi:predicted ATPase